MATVHWGWEQCCNIIKSDALKRSYVLMTIIIIIIMVVTWTTKRIYNPLPFHSFLRRQRQRSGNIVDGLLRVNAVVHRQRQIGIIVGAEFQLFGEQVGDEHHVTRTRFRRIMLFRHCLIIIIKIVGKPFQQCNTMQIKTTNQIAVFSFSPRHHWFNVLYPRLFQQCWT